MTRIAICNPVIEPGDAASNDVLAMFDLLTAAGHKVGLFAHTVEGVETPAPVRPIEEACSFLRTRDSVLILHFALGWDAGLELLRKCPGRRVFRYHNVTPPEFFEGINPGYVEVCRAGKSQVAGLRSFGIELFLPCSQFSREELVSYGVPAQRTCVVPPFHQADRLEDVEADLNELDHWSDNSVNLLTVGRVAPNKGHELLIDAFAAYCELYEPCSRLIVVGSLDPKLLPYSDRLHDQAQRRGVESRLIFKGKVSIAALKACYLVTRMLLVGSRHEGFCVPLLEAMRLRVPVVGYGCPGVSETMGDSGLLWDDPDPLALAASVHRVVSDEGLAHELAELGWDRYATEFTNRRIGQRFLESLGGLL